MPKCVCVPACVPKFVCVCVCVQLSEPCSTSVQAVSLGCLRAVRMMGSARPLLLLLLLLCLDVTTLTALRRGSLCKAVGGSCHRRKSTCRGRTQEDLCEQAHSVCCLKERRYWWGPAINTKRIYTREETCGFTSRSCSKRGGHCQGKQGSCSTIAVDQYCEATFCQCCLGNHKRCKGGVGCKLRGGICIKGNKKQCKNGRVLKKTCKGKRCSCCVPGQCSCGKPNNQRIVGGFATVPPHKYPWMVGLQMPEAKKSYFCGGAIINSQFVLTAAHCLFNLTTELLFSVDQLKIGVGDHDQSSTDDDIPGATKLVGIKEIIIPEGYKFLFPDDDISLIRLDTPLDLTSYDQVRAVCLPTSPKKDYFGETGIAYGWGVMKSGSIVQADEIREVSFPIWNKKCNGKKVGTVKITRKMLCAGDKKGGKDTCLGDSGGPLTVDEGGFHTLVGITSFGSGCGKPNSPGVYTRVAAYLDWIYEHTQETSFCND